MSDQTHEIHHDKGLDVHLSLAVALSTLQQTVWSRCQACGSHKQLRKLPTQTEGQPYFKWMGIHEQVRRLLNHRADYGSRRPVGKPLQLTLNQNRHLKGVTGKGHVVR
ncbi:hypothetical protein TNCV_1119121 [Trichonephila clavipes]|uniref:Uncharacterized protein n=1 Tax=Trichonephila clavipes TaxID=2585209 RepID=A0A8X6VS76_TRICX|nr:hypothetical protein TNCV_1119121 [Trichonephila clavipes]